MLLLMDGFEGYTDTEYEAGMSLWSAWNNGSAIVDAYGRRGSKSVRLSGGNYYDNRHSWATAVSTVYASCYARRHYGDAAQWNGITFQYDGDNQCTILVTSSGRVKVVLGYWNSSTVIGQTDPGKVRFNGFHIECKVYIHDTAGTVDVKINGVSVLALTSVDTKGSATYSTCNGISFNSGSSNYWYLDDVVVWDSTGAQFNSWMGDMEVVNMAPDADGSTTEWTPSTGNNYECVDEYPPSTTDYNSVSSADQVDLFSFANVPTPASATVHAVQVQAMLKKDSSGTRKFRFLTYISSTEYAGADQALSDTDTYYGQIWELNPATSAAWTDALINGAEFGVESRGT